MITNNKELGWTRNANLTLISSHETKQEGIKYKGNTENKMRTKRG